MATVDGWSHSSSSMDSVTRRRNKKLPNFLNKIAQKVGTHFLRNSDIIRNSPKNHQNIWPTFVRQFVAKYLQKSPNLVTLSMYLMLV